MSKLNELGRAASVLPLAVIFMLGPLVLLQIRASESERAAVPSVWMTSVSAAELQAVAELAGPELKCATDKVGALRGAEQRHALLQLKPQLETLVLAIPPEEAEVIMLDPVLQAARVNAATLQGDSRLNEIWRLRTIARVRLYGGIPLKEK